MDDSVGWVDDGAVDEVVGEIEQCPDEHSVALDHLGSRPSGSLG